MLHYGQRTSPHTAVLRARIVALAAERRRFGYRRIHALLRREGKQVNVKRVHRLYREERCRCNDGADAAGSPSSAGHSPSRSNRTRCGRWISSAIHSSMAGG